MAMYLTKNRYRLPPHIRLLNRKLLDVAGGRIKRLIVNMPPRHGKSEIISKYFPAWYLGSFPEKRAILTSYVATLASDWGRKTKDIIREFGQELFGVRLNESSRASHRWDIQGRNGGLLTAGSLGPITGKGADIFIIDDPIKNDKDANSPTMRDALFEWFRATANTRLEPNAAIILVMTRWNYDDLAGRLIKHFPEDWEVLSFPAIAKEDDILGRKRGDVLWPERYDVDALKKIRKQSGAYWFSALYQQEPIASEYQIFKPEWWKHYESRPSCGTIIQSWDTAFKEGQENDYSVCTTWGVYNSNFYLLDCFKRRLTFPNLLLSSKTLYNKYRPNVILIEDSASGQDLIAMLRSETHFPIIPMKASNKVTRAHLVSPIIESGRVYLPKKAAWLDDYLDELTKFPFGEHDDAVDSTTFAITYLNKVAGGEMNKIGIPDDSDFNEFKNLSDY